MQCLGTWGALGTEVPAPLERLLGLPRSPWHQRRPFGTEVSGGHGAFSDL